MKIQTVVTVGATSLLFLHPSVSVAFVVGPAFSVRRSTWTTSLRESESENDDSALPESDDEMSPFFASLEGEDAPEEPTGGSKLKVKVNLPKFEITDEMKGQIESASKGAAEVVGKASSIFVDEVVVSDVVNLLFLAKHTKDLMLECRTPFSTRSSKKTCHPPRLPRLPPWEP